MVGVLALGGWGLAIPGARSRWARSAFSAYLAQKMAGPGEDASLHGLTLGKEAQAVIRVFDIIESRPVITDKPGAIETARPDANGLSFDDVRFGYCRPSRLFFDARPVAAGSKRARRSPWSERGSCKSNHAPLLLARVLRPQAVGADRRERTSPT